MPDSAPPLRSPTGRLMAGLAFTLVVIGAYAAYTLHSVARMRDVQTRIVESNRLATLQLIRIQNDLNALGLAMRDMLDGRDGYPVRAWQPALARIRQNLEAAIRREAELTGARRAPAQTAYLRTAFAEFWQAADTLFTQPGPAAEFALVRRTLQPRQEALTALVARLLVENNERESQAAAEVESIYAGIERNAYFLLALSVTLIAVTSLGLIRSNREVFARLSELAQERRDLARQLITTQESTFRSISRDLHDEFGQILTAVGALLRRAGHHAASPALSAGVQEVSVVVQGALEKTRSLSQSLQPVILEEQGLLPALRWHLETFERHTGIRVQGSLPEGEIALPVEQAIHVFRILQEALNNVARHAGVNTVNVTVTQHQQRLTLVVEDAGTGFRPGAHSGVGLTAMRERAALVEGRLTIGPAPGGGTRLVLSAPLPPASAEPAPALALPGAEAGL